MGVEGLKLRVLIAPDSLGGVPGITPFGGWGSILVETEVGVKSPPGGLWGAKCRTWVGGLQSPAGHLMLEKPNFLSARTIPGLGHSPWI